MALFITLVPLAQAQNSDGGTTSNTLPPVVTVCAPDDRAAEAGPDTGLFAIVRSGPTNNSLLVFYTLLGSGQNGVDYDKLGGNVTIPAGAVGAHLVVKPIADTLVEGDETVVLQLVSSPTMGPIEPYCLGVPSNAVVTIADNDHASKNQLPVVLLQEPNAGVVLTAPATVEILADTVDPDGYVGRVEFFEGGNKIGEDFKLFFIPPPPGQHISYGMIWSNLPAGRFVLTAKAYDDQDAWSISPPVTFTVVESNPPPVTNVPPVVSMTAPDPFASEGLAVWLSNNVVGVSTLAASTWWHTNMVGTNTATFKVSRHGSTNHDLTVYYAASGTASNGVDYVSALLLIQSPPC